MGLSAKKLPIFFYRLYANVPPLVLRSFIAVFNPNDISICITIVNTINSMQISRFTNLIPIVMKCISFLFKCPINPLVLLIILPLYINGQNDQLSNFEALKTNTINSGKKNGYSSILNDGIMQRMVFCTAADGAYEADYTVKGVISFNNTEYAIFSSDLTWPDNTFYVREDTIHGKLWAYDISTNKEWLTVDMSLTIGDTFLLAPRYEHYYDTISIVEDVYYDEAGLKHILLNAICFNSAIFPYYHKLEFIEGIGASYGLGFQVVTNFPVAFSYQELLICAFQNQDQIYSLESSSLENCHLLIDNVSNVYKQEFKIYPNPCRSWDDITLVGNYETNLSLLLIDFTGRTVITMSDIKSKKIINPFGGISSGLYILKILDENDALFFSTKLIVD